MTRSCQQWLDDLNALLDDDLAESRAVELTHHLASCPACRAAAVQLGRLRRMLSAPSQTATPSGLSDRLTAIAGDAADQPLWMRTTATGTLPSPRRRRRARMVAGSATTVVLVLVVLGLGLVMAPSLPHVSDARAVASLEYDLSTGWGPVAGAVSAVQATEPGRLHTTDRVDSPRLMSEIVWTTVSASAAKSLLAGTASPRTSYRGVQRVMLGSGSDYVVAEVECGQSPGSPMTIAVLDANHRPVNAGLLSLSGHGAAILPAGAASFQQSNGGVIAGEATTLLEAHRADGSLLSRWWISEGMGLVMWSEAFDVHQQVVHSAGFISFSANQAPAGSTSPLQVSLAATSVATPSEQLCSQDFSCPASVTGLPLIEMRADSASHPTVVSALYGAGDTRVSVTMRRGQLTEAPHKGYGVAPDRSVVAWQSGSVVYTVTTNAGHGAAQAVADELPHEAPAGTSVWSRVKTGLRRLFG